MSVKMLLHGPVKAYGTYAGGKPLKPMLIFDRKWIAGSSRGVLARSLVASERALIGGAI